MTDLEILKAMTQSNTMVGKADGWHFYRCNQHKAGPIGTLKLLELREKGLTKHHEGVDRILVSDLGIKRLQENGLWPLGPFSDPIHNSLHDPVCPSERMPEPKI